MKHRGSLQAKRILIAQLALTLVLSIAALSFGMSVFLSVLIGAGTCVVANALFAYWIFGQYRAQEAGMLVMRLYAAEVIKLSLVLGVFALAFATFEGLNLPALLIAYFAVQVFPTVFASGPFASRPGG